MKITAFNPIYGTENTEEAVRFFEGLGFSVSHRFEKEGFALIDLTNETGLRLDIMNSPYVREHHINGFFSCRLNVADLQEAVAYFEAHGGKAITPLIKEGDSRELINIRTANGDLYSVIRHIS